MKIIAVAGRMGTGKDTVAEILASHGYKRVALADAIKQIVRQLFFFDRETLFGPSEARNRPVSFTEGQWHAIFYLAGSLVEGVVLPVFTYAMPSAEKARSLSVEKVYDSFSEYVKECYRRDREQHNFSARVALQLLGTEFGRALRDDLWIANLDRAIRAISFGYSYDPLTGPDYDNYATESPPVGVVITDCRFPNEAEAVRKWGGDVYWIDASRRLVIPPSNHASEPDREAFEGLLTGDLDNNGDLAALEAEVLRAIA